ncbi:MAG: hypothetical protein IKH65_07390 [Clostridia bacterium]|nr:hypothetical protein [Clostridia bacterium]
MKKVKYSFAVQVLIIVLVFLTACTEIKESTSKSLLTPAITRLDETESENTVEQSKSEITDTKSKSNSKDTSRESNENGHGGAVIRPQKYRSAFYSVPASFISLVNRNEFNEWFNTIDNTSSAEEMVMKQFVLHFNISRKDFDKANFKMAETIRDYFSEKPCLNPKDFANQEDDEIYNADIVYTFDDEIINTYYLSPDYPYTYEDEFDEAVEAGKYTPQTEEWIDVDQMEADIIAKYGSAD